MLLNTKRPILYAVTDRKALKGVSLYTAVEKAIRGGIDILQLREKELSYDEFLKEAIEIGQLCRENNITFIINDNIDIAIESDADGVHIGQIDITADEAGKRLGKDKIIGVSAHNVWEALRAVEMGADYLGAGAVFPTISKSDVTKLEITTLRDIALSVDIPVVAIGGIDENNIRLLRGSEISGVAVISAVFSAEDIEGQTRLLKKRLEEIYSN